MVKRVTRRNVSATDEVAVPVSQNGQSSGCLSGARKRESDGHAAPYAEATSSVWCLQKQGLLMARMRRSTVRVVFNLLLHWSFDIQFEELGKSTINVLPVAERCMQAQKILAFEDTVTVQISELKAALEQPLPLCSLKKGFERLVLIVKRMCNSEQQNEKGREWIGVG